MNPPGCPCKLKDSQLLKRKFAKDLDLAPHENACSVVRWSWDWSWGKKKKKHATFSPFLDVTMGRHVPNVTMKGFGACFQCHDAACAGSGAGLLARNRMDQKVWGLPVLDFLFKC
jgi:hypothetical protein